MITVTCPRCGETLTVGPPAPLMEKFVRPFKLIHNHSPWPYEDQKPIWTLEDARGVFLMVGTGHWGEVFQGVEYPPDPWQRDPAGSR